MLTPISGDSENLFVGDRWVTVVRVTDDDGSGVGGLSGFTVVSPVGSSPTTEDLGNGFYRFVATMTEEGVYLFSVALPGYGVAAFSAYVQDLSDPFAMLPDVAEVKTYLGFKALDTSKDAMVLDALDAEIAAQRAVCRVPVVYPADLAQALKRRVARNLALRGMPVMVLRGDAESGSLVPPGRDAEVRRLEGPYRKLVQP